MPACNLNRSFHNSTNLRSRSASSRSGAIGTRTMGEPHGSAWFSSIQSWNSRNTSGNVVPRVAGHERSSSPRIMDIVQIRVGPPSRPDVRRYEFPRRGQPRFRPPLNVASHQPFTPIHLSPLSRKPSATTGTGFERSILPAEGVRWAPRLSFRYRLPHTGGYRDSSKPSSTAGNGSCCRKDIRTNLISS